MDRTEKAEQELEQQRTRCQLCGSWLAVGDSSCTVCVHDGIDPQEYVELFWEEA
jgi:hypothetical protein